MIRPEARDHCIHSVVPRGLSQCPPGTHGYVTQLPCPTTHRSSSNGEHIFARGGSRKATTPTFPNHSPTKARRQTASGSPSTENPPVRFACPLAQRNPLVGHVTKETHNAAS